MTRHTTICVGTVFHLDPEIVRMQPGVDLYHVDGDAQDQIDTVLLDHLHCWRTIVFVSAEGAMR